MFFNMFFCLFVLGHHMAYGDLSSPAKDWTQGLGNESMES